MADMLVRLYELPSADEILQKLRCKDYIIRRANTWERSRVRVFVERHFSQSWADEIEAAYANKPVTLYIAIKSGEVIGFAAYECTRRAFFGPAGVIQNMRGQGVGAALLLAGLHGLREMGYAYGIIGGAGPTEFYARACGATIIENSSPGIYGDPLSAPVETAAETAVKIPGKKLARRPVKRSGKKNR
jgi:predicted N-acetyltransferase YhbS